MPHTLEKVTLSAMRMHQANAATTDPGSKKVCPMPKPKNCEYHSAPANAQNNRLLA